MKTNTTHTPTPWGISKISNNYDEYMIYGDTASTVRGCNICNTVYGGANAAFIVKACNMHDNLLVLCRALVDVIESELTLEAQAACPELIAARVIIREGVQA